MSRSLPEWIGKNDDTPVPPRVRARIFIRCGGICHLSGRAIRPAEAWDLDHIKALWKGGEHRESNMAPALVQPHRAKTRHERAMKAKEDRVRKKHLGLRKRKGRGFPCGRDTPFKKKITGEVVRR